MPSGSSLGTSCPRCGAPTAVDGPHYESHGAHDDEVTPQGPEIEVLLDNIRSLRNVGSMFRTADGVGIRHMHLGGVTPTPEHEGIAKTALGAEHSVPWTHHRDGAAAAASLRRQGLRLWALEGGPSSIPVFDVVSGPREPAIVLVLGHEVAGIDVRILRLCDRVLRLPMLGIKGSLNVSVALGVAAYLLRFGPSITGEPRLP